MGLIFNYIYKKKIVKRYDDDHIIFNYSYKDFDGLNAKEMSFKTKDNLLIKGNYYSYPNYKKDHLVIFCHGLGGGHRNYMKEIEMIARQGYEVLAYDNVGCWESEGKSIRGLTESLKDLHECLLYLDNNHLIDDKKISLIGHSWGGYAVSNILNYFTKNIYSICDISGFISFPVIAKQFFNKFTSQGYKFEKKINPEYVDSSAYTALKDTKVKTLIVHSLDDTMVNYLTNSGYLKENISNPNVNFLIVNNKRHNPNYTLEANKLLFVFVINFNKLKNKESKKKFVDSLDFDKITEQDKDVWNVIFDNMK